MFKEAEALEAEAKRNRGSSQAAEETYQGVHDALLYLENMYDYYGHRGIAVGKLGEKIDEARRRPDISDDYVSGMIDCLNTLMV